MGKVLLQELLDKNFTLDFKFRNLTSETVVDKIRMISISNTGCTLELPTKTCAKGHQVLICFLVKIDQVPKVKAKQIEVVGKITELAPIDDKTCEITLQYTQFITEEWQLLLDFFERKQNFITKILDTMKSA